MSDARRVRITSEGTRGTIEIDGADCSEAVSAYSLHHDVGRRPELVIQIADARPHDFDGYARVVVGTPPDPGPAAAAFLAAIDPALLERAALSRHDLMVGGPHEGTRVMLAVLQEWASGEFQVEGG